MKQNNFSAFLAGSDDPREYLRYPQKMPQGAAYTSGHIGVISFAEDGKAIDPKGAIAKIMADIVSDCQSITDWHPCPEINPDLHKCKACDGTGKTPECPECEGDGYLEFENDYNTYEADCKSCEANTMHVCKFCYGKGIGGRKSNHPEVLLNGTAVNPAYIKLIFDNLVNPVLSPDKENKKIYIKFDGGVGCLMGLTSHSDKAIEILGKDT